MLTRREFLLNAGLFGASALVPDMAFGSATEQFTRMDRVRAVTKRLSVQPRRWEWIVGHHSATQSGNAEIFGREHMRRGMENGLAYHFVIGNGTKSGEGEIEIGPRWLKQIKGGHVHREEINEVGIGICLVGNFEENRPTARQLTAFKALVDYLREDVVGKSIHFAVHREIDPGRTACPGKHFPIREMHARYGKFAAPKMARQSVSQEKLA